MMMNDASYATHGAARIRPPRSVPATCEESVKLHIQERGPPRSGRAFSGELRLPIYERERELCSQYGSVRTFWYWHGSLH